MWRMNRETFGLLSIINDWSTGESTLTWTGNQPASADNWAARKLTVVEDRNGSIPLKNY